MKKYRGGGLSLINAVLIDSGLNVGNDNLPLMDDGNYMFLNKKITGLLVYSNLSRRFDQCTREPHCV